MRGLSIPRLRVRWKQEGGFETRPYTSQVFPE